MDIIIPVVVRSISFWNRYIKKGRKREAVIAPSETYLPVIMTATHTRSENKAGKGNSPITTPKPVETPLPPLPFKNIEKLWPAIEAIPVDIT